MLQKLGEIGLWKLGVYFTYLCAQVLILGALMLITSSMIAHSIMMLLTIVLYFAVCLKDPGVYLANPESNMEDISVSRKSQKGTGFKKKKVASDQICDKEVSRPMKREQSGVKVESEKKQKKKTSIEERASIVQVLPVKAKEEAHEENEPQANQIQDKGQGRMVIASAKMIFGAAKNMFGNLTTFMSRKNLEPPINLQDRPDDNLPKEEQKSKEPAMQGNLSINDEISPKKKQQHCHQPQEEQQDSPPHINSNEKVVPNPNPKPCNQSPSSIMTQTKRYCRMCEFYQPLRVRHCHSCEQCIATFDHHCPWLSTCIGEKNKMLFIFYLLTQTLQFLVIFIDLVRYLSSGTHSGTAPVGILLFVVVLVLIVMVLLLSFHLYLAVNNLTTWELFRWEKIEYLAPFDRKLLRSPFSLGWRENLAILLDTSLETANRNWQEGLPDSLSRYLLNPKQTEGACPLTNRNLYRSQQNI